jgi:alpha-L-rhamnosidase
LAYDPGITLPPRTRVYWRVSVWGDKGDFAQSEANWLETGKGNEKWDGEWISSPDPAIHPVLRKKIELEDDVESARIYATGFGVYELEINGVKAGDEFLAPGCNAYDKWLQVQTYDVTELLSKGENEILAWLGNGWAKGRFGLMMAENNYVDQFSLLFELRVTLKNGKEIVIGSDGSWESAPSPVKDSGIYDGERVDARVKLESWAPVKLLAPECGELSDRLSLPVKIMEEVKPIAIIDTPAGEKVLDMGQNMVGFVSFKPSEPEGAKLSLKYSEVLQEGNFYRDNLRSAIAEFHWISSGKKETARPRFTFFGFRYVLLEGFSDPKLEDFTGHVLYSEMERTGFLETSHKDANRLYQNVIWSQKGNFLDVPTDCPQRDERMGWTGDAQIFCETSAWNMDVYAFFSKYLHDLALEQGKHEGRVPHVVPDVRPRGSGFSGIGGGACGWADAAVVIPWTMYQFYGDKTILKRQYSSMKAWVDWIESEDKRAGNKGLWTTGVHFGDWLSLDSEGTSRFGGTEAAYLASAYYMQSARIVSETAKVLGCAEDAEKYAKLSERVRQALLSEYITPSGRLAIRSQTAHVIAIGMGIAPEHNERLAKDLGRILVRDGMKLTTGFLGTPLLCKVLSDTGAHAYALKLFFKEDLPGWLYEVKQGATTIWERWNSVLPDGSMSDTGMNSLNHYAYGSIADWMYRRLAGISPTAPGWRKARLEPLPCKELTYARASFNSPMGLYKLSWERKADGTITVEGEVPFGASAVLVINGEEQELNPGTFAMDLAPFAQKLDPGSIPLGVLMADPKAGPILLQIAPFLKECPENIIQLGIREFQREAGALAIFGKIDYDAIIGMIAKALE